MAVRASNDEVPFIDDGEWKEATLLTDQTITPGVLSLEIMWRRFRDSIDLLTKQPSESPILRMLSRRQRRDSGYGRVNPESTTLTASPVQRTVSYDALRGLACVIVFNFHYLYPYTETSTHGYGYTDSGILQQNISQLPILCILVRGRAMVLLFFAISGYVLSSGFLAKTRNGHTYEAVSRLSSLTLRRWLRLYPPASLSMFLVAFAAAYGAFDAGRIFLDQSPLMTGEAEPHPPRGQTLAEQMEHFRRIWWLWSNPWTLDNLYSPYDPHTWTIPVEFRGSMVLFVILLASLGLKNIWRTILIVLLSAYCVSTGRWDYAIFVGGASIASLHQTWPVSPSKGSSLPVDARVEITSSLPWQRSVTVLNWIAFTSSLWVMSYPDVGGQETPGFIFLYSLTPSAMLGGGAHAFWQSIGALLVLWSVERLHLLQRILSSRIPQYLGRISFSLYLVHGPLLLAIGMPLQLKIWELVGREALWQWLTGLFLGWMIMLPVSILVGHAFMKVIDVPLVKFARCLERLVCEKR